MSTHSTSAHGHGLTGDDLERGNHQEDAVDFGAIVKVGIGLTVVTIASYLLVWGVYVLMNRVTDDAAHARRYPMVTTAHEQLGHESRMPPAPRLQVDPKQELKDLRAAEADALEHYGWIDKNAGVVRLPIEAAMKLTLERGLPARPATAAPAAVTMSAAPPAATQEHR